MTHCSILCGYRSSEENIAFIFKVGGDTFLQNFDYYLEDNTASQPTRPYIIHDPYLFTEEAVRKSVCREIIFS